MDPTAEEALYDIECMRRFALFELGDDTLPDETTILNFRRMIETYNLSQRLFNDVNDYLYEQGIHISQGSMVNATIIQAPNSTNHKNS